jgi:starch-binding outer membrane protein, SusD/RagB family
MKKVFIIILAVGILANFFSCSEDFLNLPPSGVFSEVNLNSPDGVNRLLIGAYSSLNGDMWNVVWNRLVVCPQGAIAANMHGGEALKGANPSDNSAWNEYVGHNLTSSNGAVQAFFQFYYDAVFKCNDVLKTLANTTGLTDAQRTEIIAETRFLRAHYYFMLKRAYKNIPWIDENTVDVKVPNTVNNDGVTFVNIWSQICEDMDFARKNLPTTQKDLGRPNKWAADCYYAKMLIYRANEGDLTTAGYTDALAVLNDVMANGVTAKGDKYGLLPYYYFNFSAAHENGPESVFAVQHSVNDGITTIFFGFGAGPNGNNESKMFGVMGDVNAPGWGVGWGFYQPSQWYVDHFRVDTNGLPYLDMYETNPNSVKSDMYILSTSPFTPDTCELDPRLDLSVGRRGIPFMDYGVMPGKSWIRSQENGGPYILKKWFVKNSEAGIYTPSKTQLRNAINYCIIRYPDVLLFAAECEARVGSLANARDLVNQVRNRMVQNADNVNNRVKLVDGVTDAANYLIGLYPSDGSAADAFKTREGALDAILYERTLELGLEGHRFYDVQRFGKGEEEFNGFLEFMGQYFDWMTETEYTEVPDAYCPIPRTAIDNSQVEGKATLTQNTGY